ncbi:hypothetical protein [Photobacterium jeanii]|uniref:hypothetical protein n=1 Tax=Photobacterium jeanii TaxID=858640 RepID=UPI000A54A38F|nr:hypothetical protein [Photobacterium jeanii]
MEKKMLRRNISYMERELSAMKRELAMLEEREFQNKKSQLEPIFRPEGVMVSELAAVD